MLIKKLSGTPKFITIDLQNSLDDKKDERGSFKNYFPFNTGQKEKFDLSHEDKLLCYGLKYLTKIFFIKYLIKIHNKMNHILQCNEPSQNKY